MKTPKEFNKNLKNNIITMDMLEVILYSVNKRAKNCRDKKQEYYYKGKSSCYNNPYEFKTVEKYKEQEQEYYKMKDVLIQTLLQPTAIHKKQTIRQGKERYYDYEPEYEKYANTDKVVYSNSYFDHETEEVVEFVDIIGEEKIEEYFLYYETPNYSFHVPVDETKAKQYKLPIKTIDLITEGKEITELVSVQFCKKVFNLVVSNNYKFVYDKELIAV